MVFGGHGEVDHGLAQGNSAFGRAQALLGERSVVGDLHGARVCQANVFPGHAHRAAGQMFEAGQK